MNKILVIEDDAAVRENVLELLEEEGFTALAAADGKQGIALAVQHLPDLVICDIGMPEIDGFEVFEVLSSQPSTAVLPFIFLSARTDRASVRRGMTLGADDYLTKPFTRTELLDSIRIRLKRRRPTDSAAAPPPRAFGAADGIVMADPAMMALYDQVERAARGSISVLILGETGVGKEVMAEEIHRRSGRSGRFLALNCAALSENLLESELFGHEKGSFTGAASAREGLIEAAEGGTLFLDEVGELPASVQVKLLRVLEERKVLRVGGRMARSIDIRLLSATNRDLELEVERGQFRSDLYYRLNGFAVTVPALRERRGDIEPLACRFIERASRSLGRADVPRLSAPVLAIFVAYAWPGNIRELRNVVERAVLLCDGHELLPAHLPGKLTSASSRPPSVVADPRERLLREIEDVERRRIVEALARSGGNQTQAAELLGISRRTLVTRLGAFDLPRPRRRSP
jgi:two-component system response regulator AtoC